MQTYVLAFQNNEYQRQFFLISESGHELSGFPPKKTGQVFFNELAVFLADLPIFSSRVFSIIQKICVR